MLLAVKELKAVVASITPVLMIHDLHEFFIKNIYT